MLTLILPSFPGYSGVHKKFSVWSPIERRKCVSTRCIPSWKSNGSGDTIQTFFFVFPSYSAFCNITTWNLESGFVYSKTFKEEKIQFFFLIQNYFISKNVFQNYVLFSLKTKRAWCLKPWACKLDWLFNEHFNDSFQLRAALYDIHDIFFTMAASERMNILRHDREVRKEKMLRQMVCYLPGNVNCFRTLSTE